jgi:hypothetical protein
MQYYRKVMKYLLLPLLVIGMLSLIFGQVIGASVTPTLIQGNQTCSNLVAGTTELKVEPPGAGVYTDGTLTVTITNYTGTSFDFTSNIGIDAVFVKAGNQGNLFIYNPETFGDTNLYSPTGPQGQLLAISHISFCYDVEPPTNTPTDTPTNTPTDTPTNTPTDTPTNTPTDTPTNTPTDTPTNTPTDTPTNTPTKTPTNTPTNTPTKTPTNTPTFTPTPIPFEGCTPGYWRQTHHFDSWVVYTPNQSLESVFDVPNSLGMDNVTLANALRFNGGSGLTGAARNLLRAAVAALLNSSSLDVNYALTTAEVIQLVNTALASNNRNTMLTLAAQLDRYNNRGCPLN